MERISWEFKDKIRRQSPGSDKCTEFIAKKLKLTVDIEDKYIITDEKWFKFLLSQIISNAIKYTHEGGVKISLKGNILKISDSGIGIAKSDLPRVFDKGYTGNIGRKDTQSSGIGLYLCKQSVDLLNLEINIESDIKKGTDVIIDLSQNKTTYE